MAPPLPPSPVQHELADLARVFRERSTKEIPLSYMEYLSLSKRIRVLSLPQPQQPLWKEPIVSSSASSSSKEENFMSFSNAAKEALRILEEVKSRPLLSSRKRRKLAPPPSFVCPSMPEDEIANISASAASLPSSYRAPSTPSLTSKQQEPGVRPWWSSIWNVYDTLYSVTRRPKKIPVSNKDIVQRDFSFPSVRTFLSDSSTANSQSGTLAPFGGSLVGNGQPETTLPSPSGSVFSIEANIPRSDASNSISNHDPKAHMERAPKVTFSLPEDRPEISSTSTIAPSTAQSTAPWVPIATPMLPAATSFQPSSQFSFSFPSSNQKFDMASKASSIEIKEIIEDEKEKKTLPEEEKKPESSSSLTLLPSISAPDSKLCPVASPTPSFEASRPFSLTSTASTPPAASATSADSTKSTPPVSSQLPAMSAKGFSFSFPSANVSQSTPTQDQNLKTPSPFGSSSAFTFNGSSTSPFGSLNNTAPASQKDGASSVAGASSLFSTIFTPATQTGSTADPKVGSVFSFGSQVTSPSSGPCQPFVFGASGATNAASSFPGLLPTGSAAIAADTGLPSTGAIGGFSSPSFISNGGGLNSPVMSAGSSQGRFIIPAHKLKRRR
ncbi:hypothetical protein MDAP_000507 [Mitosporidium daphniae]|uniref:Uncharacterized protein n=1 Tax=Mitosporidium daphniae TaxID=1485682 RepID=A0A098VRC5_9MICR|nr:uncharacterized protein DI09_30p190 [Mitosporidium daphniae]KGG51603.1 hypothetical protein DI09_30p190 [Mitosporidium daphniae]|eukprot:XP_013238030.1 uncharacterized protein DI09_30p190 [Mitosporidium daphniae]